MDFAVFKPYYIFLYLYFGVFIQEQGTEGGPIKEELLIKTWSSVKGGGGSGCGYSLNNKRVACLIYGSLFKDIYN